MIASTTALSTLAPLLGNTVRIFIILVLIFILFILFFYFFFIIIIFFITNIFFLSFFFLTFILFYLVLLFLLVNLFLKHNFCLRNVVGKFVKLVGKHFGLGKIRYLSCPLRRTSLSWKSTQQAFNLFVFKKTSIKNAK